MWIRNLTPFYNRCSQITKDKEKKQHRDQTIARLRCDAFSNLVGKSKKKHGHSHKRLAAQKVGAGTTY